MSEKKKNTLPEETASAVCEKTPAKGGRMELRLAGSGGQGVILASVILAEAAVIAGKYTAQSQSYGPEAPRRRLPGGDPHFRYAHRVHQGAGPDVPDDADGGFLSEIREGPAGGLHAACG